MLRTTQLMISDEAATMIDAARHVLRQESTALALVADRLDERFAHAVDVLEAATGSVMVTGMGKSGIIGQKIAATLASTGTRAHYLHPAEAVHGDLGRIGDDDVVLALSHSGETAELQQILPTIRDFGTPIVAVTARVGSSLAKQATVAIVYGAIDEACPIRMAPSSSCIVTMAIGDALAFSLMRRRGFGPREFGKFHPSGTLGRRLQLVDDVMRTGSRLRVADSRCTVAETFVKSHRPGRRTGAIMLVGPDGRFEGLFTDSDLARLIERRELSAFDRPIADYMTRRPVVLRSGQRLEDAVHRLRDRHISEIPVLDGDGRPVGIIDIVDVLDLIDAPAEAA